MNYKEQIRDLQEKGIKLLVKWDAGGDQTPIWFELKGTDDTNSLDVGDLYTSFSSDIKNILNLPNASERYHKGEGYIFLNENNSVVLEFTSKEYMTENTDYDWDEDANEMMIWEDFGQSSLDNYPTKTLEPLPLEDNFDITPHLNRLEIKLLGEFDAAFKSRTWLNININYGDEIDLQNQVEDFYNQITKKVLDKLMEQYSEKDFVGIYIEGILQPDHSVRFKLVENAYDILSIYNDSQIVLID